jgi:hypothetical protein
MDINTVISASTQQPIGAEAAKEPATQVVKINKSILRE